MWLDRYKVMLFAELCSSGVRKRSKQPVFLVRMCPSGKIKRLKPRGEMRVENLGHNFVVHDGCDHIFFVGFLGAGKSTLARNLGELFHRTYVDTDLMVERSLGKSVARVFDEDGEDVFRDAETRALLRLEQRKSLLVSCGGGIVERSENCRLMHGMGVVVFLDGEFWGAYSMQEKLDDNYIESHYHVNADQVTTIKNGKEYDGLESTYQNFQQFWNWAMSADLGNAANYQRVCDTIDIQGLMDFVAFESYIVNWDCMLNNNNWMIWRADETDASNPYADGKWRFLLFDTEYSVGYDGQCAARRNYFKDMDRSGKITSMGSLFFKLMQNNDFKQQFFTRYQTVAKENFDYTKVSAKIDEFSAAVKAATNDTYRRFNIGASFDSNVKILRNFYQNRGRYAMHHLNLLYGIQDNWQDDPNMIDQFGWSIWMNASNRRLTGSHPMNSNSDCSTSKMTGNPGKHGSEGSKRFAKKKKAYVTQ